MVLPAFQAGLPGVPARIESIGGATRELEVAGLSLRLHVLGRGCSDAHLVVQYANHLFPGDLVTNDFHSWLELGYLDEWTARIDELKALQADFVHPGRGPAGTADLLDAQRHYLGKVGELIRAAQAKDGRQEPDQPALEALQQQIVEAFPGHRYDLFVWNGLAAAWREQLKRRR